jgi:hypothetical protein
MHGFVKVTKTWSVALTQPQILPFGSPYRPKMRLLKEKQKAVEHVDSRERMQALVMKHKPLLYPSRLLTSNERCLFLKQSQQNTVTFIITYRVWPY